MNRKEINQHVAALLALKESERNRSTVVPEMKANTPLFLSHLDQWWKTAKYEPRSFEVLSEAFLDIYPPGDPRWKFEIPSHSTYPNTQVDPERKGRVDLLDYALYSGSMKFIERVLNVAYPDMEAEELQRRVNTVYLYLGHIPGDKVAAMSLFDYYVNLGNQELMGWALKQGADPLWENTVGRHSLSHCPDIKTLTFLKQHVSYDLNGIDKNFIPAYRWFEKGTGNHALSLHLELHKNAKKSSSLDACLTVVAHQLAENATPSQSILKKLDKLFESSLDIEIGDISQNALFEVLNHALAFEHTRQKTRTQLSRYMYYALCCFEEQHQQGLELTSEQRLTAALIYVNTRKVFTRYGTSHVNEVLRRVGNPFCYKNWSITNYAEWMNAIPKRIGSIEVMNSSFSSQLVQADAMHWAKASDVYTFSLLDPEIQNASAHFNTLGRYRVAGVPLQPEIYEPLEPLYTYEQIAQGIRSRRDAHPFLAWSGTYNSPNSPLSDLTGVLFNTYSKEDFSQWDAQRHPLALADFAEAILSIQGEEFVIPSVPLKSNLVAACLDQLVEHGGHHTTLGHALNQPAFQPLVGQIETHLADYTGTPLEHYTQLFKNAQTEYHLRHTIKQPKVAPVSPLPSSPSRF